jgi:nucleotide-binding universal stress UspA family protein
METTTSIPAGTIVVGTDGSPSAQQAVEWAAGQAAVEHRALTIVHGTPTAARTWMTAPGYGAGPVLDDMRQDAEELLEEARAFAARRASGVEINTVYRLEDPRQVLAELSADASAVVVGSRGRGPIASLLLGSVGIAVVRHAACPVVVLRPPIGERRGGVVVGVDATEGSVAALEFAFRHAATAGAPLTVVHSWTPSALTTPERFVEHEHEEQRRELVGRVVAELGQKYPDVPRRIDLTRTPAAEALVRAAGGVDLLVVGRRDHEQVLGALHGSVALAVVEHAATTVAVVPSR